MNTKVVYSALAIALAVLSPAFCGEAPQPGDGQPLKVLMVGNSFSLSNLREMPNIAKSMGLRLDLGSLYICGCTLKRHWRNVEAAESSATNRPYVFDLYVDGRKVISEKANIQETLVRDKWDVVTVQQASHASWNPDTYHPWGDNLVAKIRELAPQAKIFVQETWSYPPWDGRLAKFGFGPEEMYRRLHVAYGAFAEQHGLDVIPVGTAAEIVPSRNSLFKKPDFHFNGEGQYLQGLMFTARLFGVDARKCEYKPEWMTAERAEEIKEAVAATLAGATPPPTAGERLPTVKLNAGGEVALTPRWEGNDIVAGSKRLSVRDDSKLVLTEGGETLFSMQYMCRAVSKATGKTLWPSPAYRFAEGGGKMSRDGNALVHESPYTLEGFTWEDAFRQRVELLPDGLVAIDVVWTDPDNDNFTFRPKGASWSVSYELSKGARFSVNGEVWDMPQAPRNGGDTWRAGPDGTIEYVLFEGDAARRFRIFTRPGEAGDTAYLFSLKWGNEFRITEKIDGRRHGYRLYLDLRQGVEARPDEDMHRKAEAQKAEASRPETVKYGVRKYEKPMEIGNYDVEIDLADGPSTNFVKFMGRRIAIDRTELKAGEKRTVSFTARVPGPYTLNRGGGTRRLSIELFTDPPQAGEKEFAPRVTPNPSAHTIYICGDSTVEDHANEPLGSWGLVLPAFVRQGWTTANFAQSGRSMKTFEEEGRLERIFEHLAKGDWVMIQFGHNDQKIKGEEAENGYTRRLGEWIDRIREKGAHPVLVTPVERRGFSSGKQWGKSLAKYAEAVKSVAAAKDVPYIDLNDASYRMMGALGAEGSKRLQRPAGGDQVDNTHHNMYGAYEMARIIAAGLAKIPVVGDAIREPYREFDPEKPDAESAVAIPPSGVFRNVKPAGD